MRAIFLFPVWNVLLQARVYPNRWVYVSKNLGPDRDVEDIRQIAQTAAHDLNGLHQQTGQSVEEQFFQNRVEPAA